MSYNEALAPRPRPTREQIRTISAWGGDCQADLVRLRVGLVGAGSVGGMIGEALARTGFENIIPIDFDYIEIHNLDRLLYARRSDVERQKAQVLAEHLRARTTAAHFTVDPVVAAVFEEKGFARRSIAMCFSRAWTDHGDGMFSI